MIIYSLLNILKNVVACIVVIIWIKMSYILERFCDCWLISKSICLISNKRFFQVESTWIHTLVLNPWSTILFLVIIISIATYGFDYFTSDCLCLSMRFVYLHEYHTTIFSSVDVIYNSESFKITREWNLWMHVLVILEQLYRFLSIFSSICYDWVHTWLHILEYSQRACLWIKFLCKYFLKTALLS